MFPQFGKYDSDAPLERATALPPGWYVKPEALALEREHLFHKSWQVVGRADQVAERGQYFTTALCGEPLVILRDSDGTLRAFYNVCRHRAGPPATGEGRTKALRCAYHGWTYDLDGSLRGTPEFAAVEGFDKKSSGLVPVRVEAWGPLLLVNLDREGAPLSSYLDDLPARVERFEWSRMKFGRRVDYTINCNWKLYVENYLEGYHIPHIHPSLNKLLDYSQYRTEVFRYYSLQYSPTRPVGPELAAYAAYAGDEALYAWVFPNIMLNLYRGVFSVNMIMPLGPDRTVTHFDFYFHETETDTARRHIEESIRVSDEIQQEDVGICERVQQNLASASYVPGRLSVSREAGVHHFQTTLTRWLAERGRP